MLQKKNGASLVVVENSAVGRVEAVAESMKLE